MGMWQRTVWGGADDLSGPGLPYPWQMRMLPQRGCSRRSWWASLAPPARAPRRSSAPRYACPVLKCTVLKCTVLMCTRLYRSQLYFTVLNCTVRVSMQHVHRRALRYACTAPYHSAPLLGAPHAAQALQHRRMCVLTMLPDAALSPLCSAQSLFDDEDDEEADMIGVGGPGGAGEEGRGDPVLPMGDGQDTHLLHAGRSVLPGG